MGSEMRGTVYVIALCHCLKDPLVFGRHCSVGVKQADFASKYLVRPGYYCCHWRDTLLNVAVTCSLSVILSTMSGLGSVVVSAISGT